MNYIHINPLVTRKHEEFRLKVRDFAENVVKPKAADLDASGVFSEELTLAMGKSGLLGMTVPEKYGGTNLDTLSYIIAVEELARIDSSQAATVAAQNSLGLAPIVKYGTEEQKLRILPGLMRDSKLWAFGLTEPNAGSDANNTETEIARAYNRDDLYWSPDVRMSTYWLENCSYMRLKNIVLNYAIPSEYYSKAGIAKISVYVSGNDVALLYTANKIWDPEANNPGVYPLMKTFAIGANITF